MSAQYSEPLIVSPSPTQDCWPFSSKNYLFPASAMSHTWAYQQKPHMPLSDISFDLMSLSLDTLSLPQSLPSDSSQLLSEPIPSSPSDTCSSAASDFSYCPYTPPPLARPPVHVVCNAPLLAPIPLSCHSPAVLQFDLPEPDADLSTTASTTTFTTKTLSKRPREQENDSLYEDDQHYHTRHKRRAVVSDAWCPTSIAYHATRHPAWNSQRHGHSAIRNHRQAPTMRHRLR